MGEISQKLWGIDYHLGPQLDLHLLERVESGRSRTSILSIVTLICDDCEEDLDTTYAASAENIIAESCRAVEN